MTGFQSKRAMSQQEWAEDSWHQEQKSKRWQYWKMLRSAHADYIKLTEQCGIESEMGHGAFEYYLRHYYGIQTELIDGNISGNYNIIDEKKHLIFLIKYS
jgi:hypothetical protein